MSTLSLLNTGILVLASAVKKAFPTAIWAHAGTRGNIIFCDFYMPQPVHEKISLEVISQALHSEMNELETLSSREMLLGNALAFLKHEKGLWPDIMEEGDRNELVTIAEINGKFLLANGPVLSDCEELASCRLWEVTPLPCEISPYAKLVPVRFTGYAVADKAELSSLQKKLNSLKKNDPLKRGVELGLFVPPSSSAQRWVWLQKGMQWRNSLKFLMVNALDGKMVKGTSLEDPEDINEILNQHTIALLDALERKTDLPLTFFQEIEKNKTAAPFSSTFHLYDTPTTENLTGHIFCFEEKLQEELISSLQRIEKTYKMFGVEWYWALRSSKPRKFQDKAVWKKTQYRMQQAIDLCGYQCVVLPSDDDQLGPQIELMINDSYGQPWTMARIVAHAEYPLPAIIQVTPVESLERLIAVLLEHHTKENPLWLATV